MYRKERRADTIEMLRFAQHDINSYLAVSSVILSPSASLRTGSAKNLRDIRPASIINMKLNETTSKITITKQD